MWLLGGGDILLDISWWRWIILCEEEEIKILAMGGMRWSVRMVKDAYYSQENNH